MSSICCLLSWNDIVVLHKSCQHSKLIFRDLRWSVIYTHQMGERAAQSKYTYRLDGEASQGNILRSVVCKLYFFLCKQIYLFKNTKLPYLFSNHFGLFVNFLPIGHVTQEVMALSSREGNFFSRLFEALFCSAPQDYLVNNKMLIF